MKTFQITLTGYNAATDETDDHIVWIVCQDLEMVKSILKTLKVRYDSIDTLDIDIEDNANDFTAILFKK